MVSDVKFSQFMIAGTNSGSGKTTLTLGILRALSRRNLQVAPFKCGPDYIDPLFHAQAAGRKSLNLDGFFQSESCYADASKNADVAVTEGVMGLFDGVNPGTIQGSSGEIALHLNLPVILTVNARGMSGSIAPVVKGFCQWRSDVNIVGVIANQVGSVRHAQLLSKALQAANLPPLIGFLPRDERWILPERHLGLAIGTLDAAWLDALADTVEQYVNLDLLLERTRSTRPECETRPAPPGYLRLGVAWDEAFCFYYQANFDCLRRHGVETVLFSPLHDAALPDHLNGIYLGGGYPELYLKQLSENISMRRAIQKFALDHFVYGECGGYLYLLDEIRDFAGDIHSGLGLLPGKAHMNHKLAELGYRTVRGEWGTLRGHEFHYSSLDEPPGAPCLWQARDLHGKQYESGGIRGRVRGSYIHLYFDSNPAFAEHFCRELEL